MRVQRWIPQALFVGAALLSAWLSPVLPSGFSAHAPNPLDIALLGGLNGRTLLRSNEALEMKIANVPDAHEVMWQLDGRPVGHSSVLHLAHVDDGDHLLSLTYRDAEDRLFAVNTTVRVLPPEAYDLVTAAIQSAIALPLWAEDEQVYLPSVVR